MSKALPIYVRSKALLTYLSSDLDINVDYFRDLSDEGEPWRAHFERVSQSLEGVADVGSFLPLPSIKYPIIKLRVQGIKIDVCVDSGQVFDVAEIIRLISRRYPLLEFLVVALKLLCRNAGLMDTTSGGFSSLALVCLCISFAEVRFESPSRCPFFTEVTSIALASRSERL